MTIKSIGALRHPLALLIAAFIYAPGSGAAQSFYVDGSGGVPLATTVAGHKERPAILFLHGLGHARETYSPQFQSELADSFYLVAFDLRGHGQSGKPWQASSYSEPAVWAEDVQNVIAAAELVRPVVVAWSYGGSVAADYVRIHGAEKLSGLVMVNTLGGFVHAKPPAGAAPTELAEAYRLLAEPSFYNQRQAVDLIVPMLVSSSAAPGWLERARALGMLLPPYVRPLLRTHQSDNGDLPKRLTMPVLVAYGARDASLPQAAVDALLAAVPGSRLSRYDAAGHSPFAEDADRFNRELAEFVDQVWRRDAP